MVVAADLRRHCEARSAEAIQTLFFGPGLLRFARNDADLSELAISMATR
jgi:hypothetical protein